jgi:hypothetical protein
MPDANTPVTVPPAPTFTPGPWRADRRAILTSDLRCIAVVYSGACDSLEEANATETLIAAAPDLLTKLIECEAVLAGEGGHEGGSFLEEIRAAIAKAEGRP